MSLPANPPVAPTNKPLWAAVVVLGIAVLAMGAMLIRGQSQAVEPLPAVLGAAALASDAQAASPAVSASAATVPATASSPQPVVDSASTSANPKPKVQVTNHPVAQAKQGQGATNNVSTEEFVPSPGPRVVLPQNPEPAVARVTAPARVACVNCGTVESVTPVEVEGTGSGTGAIAGGVLGAVVGNQVGGGDGKTLATILGAVGGGMAGNAVEKKMKKVTQYEVTVRMEDGSRRTLRQSSPASVGASVVVNGDSLQPANH